VPAFVAAAVTGIVVVVLDAVVVVVVDVLVVVVVVVDEVVVVVVDDEVVVASGVTVQQDAKVCGVPGAVAVTPALSAAVAYSHSAWTLSEEGELMHEAGKLRL